jgi:hypothetical protein
MQFNDVVGYQRFEGPCCLHLHGEVNPVGGGSTVSQRRRPRHELHLWGGGGGTPQVALLEVCLIKLQ